MKRIMNKIDYDFWWEKIADYAKLVGRTTARPVLLLYYVLRSPETPSSDKMSPSYDSGRYFHVSLPAYRNLSTEYTHR